MRAVVLAAVLSSIALCPTGCRLFHRDRPCPTDRPPPADRVPPADRIDLPPPVLAPG